MDPQDPNTPNQPDVDHSNPFDQFYADGEDAKPPENAQQDLDAEAQKVLDSVGAGDTQQTLPTPEPPQPVQESESPVTDTTVPEPTPEQAPMTSPEETQIDEVPTAPAPEDISTKPIQTSTDPAVPEGMAPPEPEMPLPDMPETSKTNDNFYPAQKVSIKGSKIIMGLILFLIMSVLGVVGALAATGNLTTDTGFLQPVMIQLQKLPFVPKSPKFIMSQALTSNMEITSFHYDISASVNLASQQFGVTSGLLSDDNQFDFEMVGDVAFLDEVTVDKLQSAVTLQASAADLTGSLSVNLVADQNMSYIQLDSVTGAFGFYSEFLPPAGEWFSFDNTALDSQARAALDATVTPMEDDPLYDYVDKMTRELFENERFKDEVTLVGTESLSDNTPAYHLQIEPSIDTMVSIITSYNSFNETPLDAEDVAILRDTLNEFQTFYIDVWVDEDNYIMRKFQLVISYAFDANEIAPALPIVFQPDHPVVAGVTKVLSEGDMPQDTIDLSLVTEFTNINQPPVITIPTAAIPIEEYYSSLYDSILGAFDSLTVDQTEDSSINP